MGTEKQYIDLFTSSRETICRHSSGLMNSHREAALEHFCRQGFPTRKDERYRYTDIGPLFEPNYGLNIGRIEIPVDPLYAFKCDVPNLSTSLYFIENDLFYGPSPIGQPHLPEGVVIGSLREETERRPDLLANYYAHIAPSHDDALSALNTMLAQDGLLVYVPRGVRVERPVQIVNILRSDVDMMANRRVLIVLEAHAEIKLLFCDHAFDDRHFLTTQVIEAHVGEGASLDLYCLEETHSKNIRLSNLYVEQERDSHLNHNIITLHNGLTRNKTDVSLMGPGAECTMNGSVIADKRQKVDNNTLIVHKAPHQTSRELYKYVLEGEAVGAFAGKVLVEPGAQKTSSGMTNQNLCASKQSRMLTQPMLEIYADDVKCSHGSTVGQLNDAALFYMQQRGLPFKEARLLLQQAFINEVIDSIRLEPLRDRMHHLVEKRFRGELSKCSGCKLCK